MVLGFSPHLPVSVCGTGTDYLLRDFSRQCDIGYFSFRIPRYSSQLKRWICLPFLTRCLDIPPSVCTSYPPASSLRSFPVFCGIGLSTDCPSPTPFGLGLGPDLPWVDEPSPGNLRFSTNKILTYFSLLMPTFSLLHSPPLLTVRLQPMQEAPLPLFRVHSFGGKF